MRPFAGVIEAGRRSKWWETGTSQPSHLSATQAEVHLNSQGVTGTETE